MKSKIKIIREEVTKDVFLRSYRPPEGLTDMIMRCMDAWHKECLPTEAEIEKAWQIHDVPCRECDLINRARREGADWCCNFNRKDEYTSDCWKPQEDILLGYKEKLYKKVGRLVFNESDRGIVEVGFPEGDGYLLYGGPKEEYFADVYNGKLIVPPLIIREVGELHIIGQFDVYRLNLYF